MGKKVSSFRITREVLGGEGGGGEEGVSSGIRDHE